MFLEAYHLGHGPMSDAEKEERYLLDRTCFACGDTSAIPHNCPGYPE